MQSPNNHHGAMSTPGGCRFDGSQINAVYALTTFCGYPRDPVACRREALAKLSAIAELRSGDALAWYPDMSALELTYLAAFATETQKNALRPLWFAVQERDALEAPHAW